MTFTFDDLKALREEGFTDDQIGSVLAQEDQSISDVLKEGFTLEQITSTISGQPIPEGFGEPIGTSFTQEVQQLGPAFVESLGRPLESMGESFEVLGFQGVADALKGAITEPENYVSAAQQFMEPKEDEAQFLGFAWQYAPRAAVEQAGQAIGSVATRVAGGIAGAPLGPAGVATGAFVGPAIFEAAQIIGPVAKERAQNNGREVPTNEDILAATVTAAGSGALNAIGAKYLPGGEKATGKFFKRVASSFLGEAATEAPQSIVEQVGTTAGTEAGLNINLKQAIGEGLIGGVTGAGLTGITAPFTKGAEEQVIRTPEQAEEIDIEAKANEEAVSLLGAPADQAKNAQIAKVKELEAVIANNEMLEQAFEPNTPEAQRLKMENKVAREEIEKAKVELEQSVGLTPVENTKQVQSRIEKTKVELAGVEPTSRKAKALEAQIAQDEARVKALSEPIAAAEAEQARLAREIAAPVEEAAPAEPTAPTVEAAPVEPTPAAEAPVVEPVTPTEEAVTPPVEPTATVEEAPIEPVAEAPAITPAPVEEVEFAELRNLMERRGQAQGKVKGVKFSKKDEARYNELLPKYRSQIFETITPETDPVVWKDIEGNDIKVSQKGTFYTVENGRVRTGPAFQSEGFIKDVSPQPVSAAVVESNNVPLPEGYTKQGDVYVYQAPVAETPAVAPAPEVAEKTSLEFVPQEVLEAFSENQPIMERIRKDALEKRGGSLQTYITTSVRTKGVPKSKIQPITNKILKQFQESATIAEIEEAVSSEVENISSIKEKKKSDDAKLEYALQRIGETYELDAAIQDYKNKQIELERAQKSMLITPALRREERVSAKNNLEKSKQKLIEVASKTIVSKPTPAVSETITPAEEAAPVTPAPAEVVTPTPAAPTPPVAEVAPAISDETKRKEQIAIQSVDTPKKLNARLQNALDTYGVKNRKSWTIDFENKQLISPDKTTAIKWTTRNNPNEPESYTNQQTSTGKATLVKYQPTPAVSETITPAETQAPKVASEEVMNRMDKIAEIKAEWKAELDAMPTKNKKQRASRSSFIEYIWNKKSSLDELERIAADQFFKEDLDETKKVVQPAPSAKKTTTKKDAPVLDPIGYGNAIIDLFPTLKAAGVKAISMEESLIRLEKQWDEKQKSGKATRLDQIVYLVNKKNTEDALAGESVGGTWTRKDLTVAVSSKATPSAMAHEIGHAIMELEFANADQKTKDEITAEYTKWYNAKYGKDGTPSVADQRRIWEWMEESDWLDPKAPFPNEKRDANWEKYRSSFSEWFADEVSKWATIRNKPKSLIDKFFSELAAKLSRLWDAVSENFQPNETLASWLDSITEVSPSKISSTAPAKPAGISVGSRIKLGKSPQTYTIEEVIPQSEAQKELGKQYYSVRNEKTGEVQTVEAKDIKPVKAKKVRKMAARVKDESLVVPEADRYTFEQAEAEARKLFGGMPEGFIIVNDSVDPDYEFKAGYEPDTGDIIVNLAYIRQGESVRNLIAHELGHYAAGDPEIRAKLQEFLDALPPATRAKLERFVERVYNDETGDIRLEEKQVRAFVQMLKTGDQRNAFQKILDAIKKWLNEKLGTNFQPTDMDAAAVLSGAINRFKAGEFIAREDGEMREAKVDRSEDVEKDIAIAEQIQSVVNDTISKMPQDQGRDYNAFVNEGKSEAQIAEENNTSVSQVRTNIVRGKKAVGDAIKKAKIDTKAKPKNAVLEWTTGAVKKYFTKEGDLPFGTFQNWVRRNAKLAREAEEARQATQDFYEGLRKLYKINKIKFILDGLSSIPPEDVARFNDALAGEIPINQMPTEIQEPLTRMRQHIDAMSSELIATGQLPEYLEAKAMNNLGVYLTRSYKIFTDPDWIKKIPQEKLTAARNFLYQQQSKTDPNFTIEDADRKLEQMLNDWAGERGMEGKRGGRLGAKDLSVMMTRSEVPKQLRDVMGENTNVIFNYANTIAKISRFVADQQFLDAVKQEGAGKFLFTKDAAPKGFNTLIAPEESRTMAPLSGLRTTPEIAKAFEEFGKAYDAKANPFLYAFGWLNAVGKANLTVGSLFTQARNIIGQPFFFLANGHADLRAINREVERIMKSKGLSKDKARNELVKMAAGEGLVNENAYAGELKEAFEQIGLKTFEDMDADEFSRQFVLLRLFKKGTQGAQKVYQKTDELGKLIGWLNETNRIQKMNPGMSREDAMSIASERTRNTYPTYSQGSEALRLFRRQPFFGPFATFFYETFRTTYWNVVYAFQDINSGTEAGKQEGIKRLAGTMAQIAIGAYLVNAISAMVSGIGDQEEEDVRRMLPPWAANASLVWFPKTKDGVYDFINFSSLNPYNALSDPFVTMMSGFSRGEDPTDIFIDAAGTFLSPFTSEQPVTAATVDALRNVTERGTKVYNEEDDLGTKTSKILLHIFGKAFTPGTIDRLRKRIIPAIYGETVGTRAPAPLKEISAEFTGVRFENLDMRQAFQNKAWEFNKAQNDSERIFRDVATRRRRVTEEEQINAYRRAEESRYQNWQDMYRNYMALRRAGASKQEAVRLMTDIKISKREASYIARGKYVPYEVSDEVRRRSKLNGNVVPLQEIKAIAREMPRVLEDVK